MRSRGFGAALLAPVLAAVLLAGCDNGHDGGRSGATVGSPSTASSPTRPPAYSRYVALGDSYTAAPGVPTTEQDDGCLRSNGNYPSLLAARLPGTTFVDVSCSGASVLSLIGVQQSSTNAYAPQFNALTPTTPLVTLGIGVNDFNLFTTMLTGCAQVAASDPDHAPCRARMEANSKQGQDPLVARIDEIRQRITSAVEGIHDRDPAATVVLVGYPQLVPAHGTCPILPLARGDYPYVRSLFVKLDDALAAAAEKGTATYVDVLEASQGHDICAGTDAWVNGDTDEAGRALAYHPFATEQQAVADLIGRALHLS